MILGSVAATGTGLSAAVGMTASAWRWGFWLAQ
jgi:hypothetical protein